MVHVYNHQVSQPLRERYLPRHSTLTDLQLKRLSRSNHQHLRPIQTHLTATITMDPVKDKPFSAHHEHKEDSLGEQDHVNTWNTEGTKEYDPVFVKKTIRKLDIRLLIILGAMYSIALIDRTNLSSARVAGMSVELKLCVPTRTDVLTVLINALIMICFVSQERWRTIFHRYPRVLHPM